MMRLGIVGAGLVGQQHIKAAAAAQGVTLVGVHDPYADQDQDLPWVADYAALLDRVDGVLLAVPNHLHAPMALESIQAKTAVLIEKPLAGTAAEGAAIVEAATAADVPLLVGHHRRYNPRIAAAKAMLDDGALGQLTTLHGQTWLPKPDSYFAESWRQTKGAGPLFINLIHDVDLLMHLCGPIVRVQAMESSAVRGAPVEETVVAILQFAHGMLGTVNLTDAAIGPWSWEMTAAENPAYPVTDQACYVIGGTQGSLALPNLTHWHQKDGPHWWKPIEATAIDCPSGEPLTLQLAHFADVVAGRAAPRVSGADGLRALQVVEAIKEAATTGASVTL